ncbi:hypothetical protein [Micromonospora pisi]|nr:hypothetical protein [Micromonospora pisi]
MMITSGWVTTGLGRFSLPKAPLATYQFDGDSGYEAPSTSARTHPGGLHGWMRELVPFVKQAAAAPGKDGDITMVDGGAFRADPDAALPEQFVTFMSDPVLRDSVPSCTSCYWEATLPRVPSPVREGAHLVRFLNDQQGVLFWYLHLLPDGDHEILCGAGEYDAYEVSPEDAAGDLIRVAASFDEFIARFWIENLAWYEVVWQKRADEDLSPPVREYVHQYAAASGTTAG